jgi:hypothetical protein
MTLAEIYYVSVSVSAVAATVAFIIAMVSQSRERRTLSIQKWQRAVIQQICQSKDQSFSFEEIGQRYRNEAVAYRQFNLSGDDLSPQTLRLILMQMISDRIIIQEGGDKYRAATSSSGIENYKQAMVEVNTMQHAETVGMQQVFMKDMLAGMMSMIPPSIASEGRMSAQVFNLIADEPFRYTVGDLAIKLSKELQIELDTIRGYVTQLLAKKWLVTDDRNRLGLGTNKGQLPIIGPDDTE